MCGPDVDDVIDDEVSDGDEDQILVMEEEDVDGQVHRYPGTLYLCSYRDKNTSEANEMGKNDYLQLIH